MAQLGGQDNGIVKVVSSSLIISIDSSLRMVLSALEAIGKIGEANPGCRCKSCLSSNRVWPNLVRRLSGGQEICVFESRHSDSLSIAYFSYSAIVAI